MSGRKEITAGQVAEMTNWLRRLTPEEYQKRRNLLRRATDPKQEWIGSSLLYPFTDERPMEWGWTVEREGATCENPIDIAKLELVPFHKDGETYVSGEEMMKRAADSKNFPGCQTMGQHAAEQLLARAAELPQEWANDQGPCLVFADTILVDGGGYRLVPCLIWGGGQWRLGWGCLAGGFRRGCRFVRPRK